MFDGMRTSARGRNSRWNGSILPAHRYASLLNGKAHICGVRRGAAGGHHHDGVRACGRALVLFRRGATAAAGHSCEKRNHNKQCQQSQPATARRNTAEQHCSEQSAGCGEPGFSALPIVRHLQVGNGNHAERGGLCSVGCTCAHVKARRIQ